MTAKLSLTPLNQEMRSALPTAEAARHLSRSPGTLNWWSCTGKGPIKPLRVNGRLAWPVSEIKRLMGVEG